MLTYRVRDLKRSSFDENEDFLGSQEEEANNYSFELDWFHQAHRWKVVSKDCGEKTTSE